MNGFQFAIGDLVMHKGTVGRNRQRLIILERWMHECPGGVQRHYNVRAVMNTSTATYGNLGHESGAFSKDAITLLDVEVVAYAEHPKDVVDAAKPGNQ